MSPDPGPKTRDRRANVGLAGIPNKRPAAMRYRRNAGGVGPRTARGCGTVARPLSFARVMSATSPSPHYFKRMPSGSKPLIASHGSPAPRTAPALTDLEQRILDYMVLYLRTHTYQPSIREIGHHFGIKSTKTMSELLQSLAEKGVVERDPSRSRGIRILGLDLNAQTVSLPCYRDLGEAVAGLRSGRAQHRVCLDRQLARRSGGFLVYAPGDRMTAAGIDNGDLLLIQPVRAEELTGGEIVVARVRGVTDYYQLEKRGTQLTLRAAGGERKAVGGTAQPVILGRVAGLYRHVTPLPFTGPLTAH
ncbi:MAG: hypothetical protein F4123_12420 [Gemmatimonadetes bacterium]|nr:hypothetical protein [Gemmatimonadota bacterium]MYC00069.1 hypothetical protein [Gemmatimonadota bacterium]MYI47159.1 hypothetical protein [Gemmatimonadota bacterium]